MVSKKPKSVPKPLLCDLCPEIAEFGCKHCDGAPLIEGEFTPVLYCEKCKPAYAQHRGAICKRRQTRRSFYRAAYTLEKIFYVYRRNTFDRQILKVEKSGGQLIITENSKVESEAITAWDFQEEFPTRLTAPNVIESDQMELPLLAHRATSDAIAWMYNIINYMLKSLAVRIEEVDVQVKDPKLAVVTVEHSTGQQSLSYGEQTTVLKVTLKDSDEEFALVLDHAQYGGLEPVIPWSTYVKIATVGSCRYFGATKASLMWGRFNHTVRAARANLHIEACRTLYMGMLKWESANTTPFLAIFPAESELYESCEAKLVEKIEEGLQKHLEGIKGELAVFKMYKLQGRTYPPPRTFWKRKTLPIVGQWEWPTTRTTPVIRKLEQPSTDNNKKQAKGAFKVTKS